MAIQCRSPAVVEPSRRPGYPAPQDKVFAHLCIDTALSPHHLNRSHGRVSRRPPPVNLGNGYKLQPPDRTNPLQPLPPHSNRAPRKKTPTGEAPGKGSSPEIAGRSFSDAPVLRCSQGTSSTFH